MPWECKVMTGYRINTPFIVVNPACPPGRHPTRDCGCKVFKTQKKAMEYVDEQNTKESNA